MEAALSTRLAYVITGDAQVDEASRLGLEAVSRALSNRTALSPGAPMGVDPARDELAFFPLIYWPIVATAPAAGRRRRHEDREFHAAGRDGPVRHARRHDDTAGRAADAGSALAARAARGRRRA